MAILLRCLLILAFLRKANTLCNPSHCHNCGSSDNVCVNCDSGYNEFTPVCCHSTCQTCTASSSLDGICTSCVTYGYGPNSSDQKCYACSGYMTQCITCTNQTYCTLCTANYIFNGSSCQLCTIPGCSNCTSSTVCTQCLNDTLTVSPTSSQCVTCLSLLTGCSNCNSSTICTACVNDTYVLNLGTNVCDTCESILVGCMTCSSKTACSTCLNDTYAINSSSLCALCSTMLTDCATCSSSSICTGCVNTSFVLNEATNHCDTCQVFMTACLTCSSATSCLTCTNNTYALNSSSLCALCQAMLAGCSTCSSSTICTSCVNNTYVLDPSVDQCILCSTAISYCSNCSSLTACDTCLNTSFAINSTFGCSPCQSLIPNCLYCNSSSICTNCISQSYVINSTSNLCVLCQAYLDYCESCDNTSVCKRCQADNNIVFSNNSCVKCGTLFPYCLNCTIDARCTACEKYYFVSFGQCLNCPNVMANCIDCTSMTVCTKCGSGHIVANGCSGVPGCTAIVANNYPKSICTACDQAFYHSQPVNGTCVCLKGHLAGQYCTEIIGCTKILRYNSIDSCTICETSNRFTLHQGTCICLPLYEINGSTCSEICGDGKLVYLPCDDGNLINGDGCSSTCQMERDYQCNGGDIAHPSSCIYRGLVKLHLACVYKGEGNKAQIMLTTSPFISNILKSTIIVHFNISKNCTLVNHSLVGQNIILQISYYQDIEGQLANITIEYDHNYIISPDGSSSVRLNQCNGDRLYYSTYTGQGFKTIIKLAVKALTLLVLLVWLIGSYSHKMIGVQTIHTFQLIFVPQVLAQRYFPVFVYFSQLSNILNVYQTKFTSSATLSSKQEGRLQYSADFVYNGSIVGFIQALALVAYAAFVIYSKIKRKIGGEKRVNKAKMKIKQENNCIKKINTFKQFLYDFLVFPAFIGFFLNFLLSLMVHSNPNYQKQYNHSVQAVLVSVSLFCVSIIFFNEWKYFFVKNSKDNKMGNKQNYVPFYLTNFLIVCLVLQASVLSLIPHPLLVLLSLFFLYTVTLIVYRPYHHSLHNISLVINQIGVMLNLCWLISQQFIYLSRQYQELLGLGLILWMVVILIFAIVRIVYQICCKANRQKQKLDACKNSHNMKEYQDRIISSLLKSALRTNNSYLVQSQLLTHKLLEQRQLEQRKRQHLEQMHRRAVNRDDVEDEQSEIKMGRIRKELKMAKSQESSQ